MRTGEDDTDHGGMEEVDQSHTPDANAPFWFGPPKQHPTAPLASERQGLRQTYTSRAWSLSTEPLHDSVFPEHPASLLLYPRQKTTSRGRLQSTASIVERRVFGAAFESFLTKPRFRRN